MRALIIYDKTGRVWSIVYGGEEIPQGVPYLFADIPDGAVVERVDVTNPNNHVVIFSNVKDDGDQQAEEAMKLLTKAAQFSAFSFTDEQSLAVKEIYPVWSGLPEGRLLTKKEEAKSGTEITKVLGDDGKLYKVIVTHNKQSDWAPGQATASLFTVIEENHEGTEEDPIPYSVNMIVYEGKYYTYDGVLYKCIRDSGIALQYTPDQLIDQYFQLVI